MMPLSRTLSSPNLAAFHLPSPPSTSPVMTPRHDVMTTDAPMRHLTVALEHLPLQIESAVARAVTHAMTTAQTPVHDALDIAKALAEAPEGPKTRRQKIAAAIEKWTMPIFQILLGAGMVVLGVMNAEVAFIVMGVAPIVTGVGTIIVLIASAATPHPMDAIKHFFERKHKHELHHVNSELLADTMA